MGSGSGGSATGGVMSPDELLLLLELELLDELVPGSVATAPPHAATSPPTTITNHFVMTERTAGVVP